MKLIEFPEQTLVIAKDQPQYHPMPAHLVRNKEVTIICCWKLTLWERIIILFTGKMWHNMMTFGNKLQPQLLTVEKPPMFMPDHVTGDKSEYEGSFGGIP